MDPMTTARSARPRRLGLVGRTSLRVALATTAVVAVVYLALGGAVLAIVSNNLTSQIDARLTGTLNETVRRTTGPVPGDQDVHSPPGEPRFGLQPVLFWLVAPDGTIRSNTVGATLPDSAKGVTNPRTVAIGDRQVRVVGTTIQGYELIFGQTMDQVSATQATLLRAEAILGPVLLLVVFIGAVIIGRRVAAPIEIARLRQLEFTADASHELRTPLAVIEANTSLALAQPRDETWYRRAFERVDAESRRMRRVVEDLLWLARFDATEARPASEPIDLGVLAEGAVDRFGIVAEARQIKLAVRVDPGSNVIRAPGDWLDRLLGVLLDNAIKYTPEGGTVGVRVEADQARVSVTVDDSGPGIPTDERPRIFDRFHRGTSAGGGAGLGLSIADAIVRATNGRWRIGDGPLGGARLSVSWPRFHPEQG
jgi:two-component system, OmpR family, sensor histidine kinase CiaH